MDNNQRFQLIREVGEEIITEDELKKLISEKKNLIAYDGFEPSGILHIAQGILRSINVNKMIKSGCKFKMLVADWHAWANNKLGGNLENIKTAGEYMVEVWKAAGMELDKVEFVKASSFIEDESYWKKVMEVARHSTVSRIIRCGQIMGRSEKDVLQASQILYPCMQAADIFHLDVDIAQLGVDQRKVNVLARELAPKLGFRTPVIVSHHMLLGLAKPNSNTKDAVERAIELKMSKSRPETAIFMTDKPEDVAKKINNAYCPEGAEENPILEYCRYILFEKFNELKIERDKKFGGDMTFKSYAELEKDYLGKKLHPMDLKKSVGVHINKLLDPVRNHFEKNKKARELLETVQNFKITR